MAGATEVCLKVIDNKINALICRLASVADQMQKSTFGAPGFQSPPWANAHNYSQGWEYPNLNWAPPQQQPPVPQTPAPQEPVDNFQETMKQFMRSTQASISNLEKLFAQMNANKQV